MAKRTNQYLRKKDNLGNLAETVAESSNPQLRQLSSKATKHTASNVISAIKHRQNMSNDGFTNVLVSLDVLQHGPLFVIAVVPSLGVALELFDGSSGGSAGADLVNRGRDSLAEAGLNGPDLAENLKQHRPHALVHTKLGRWDAFWSLCPWCRLGWDAVGHQRGRRRESSYLKGLLQLWGHYESTYVHLIGATNKVPGRVNAG